MWLESYISDISGIYGLSEEEVRQIIASVLEGYYSEKYGSPTVCSLSAEGLTVRQYRADGIEREIVLKKHDVTTLASILNTEFFNFGVHRKEIYLKSFMNSLVKGEIREISAEDVLLNVYLGVNYRVTGVVHKMYITPKLRGTFQTGQEIRSLVIGTERYGDDVALTLSLTSRKLVEKLFEEQGYSVRCIKRIAGIISVIQFKKHIQYKIIKRISNVLHEHIIIEALG
ncbi:hypothetical protein Dacet_0694 [Denitrovibrio acetiphilus DSM 12809]|uniref:S1 motif domain-containing protein n=1 Tax=Denitrovibrio acetiphilus (strain DSM 12809 / NBRC 114555 / N2460) TaxID=522772 RepID=D4H4T6_DENA2|nr:hypothetical protein [Denitrovibrio acetiphilus]ADD67480.1 hypothetical protein Dacet_0694 [Denitrovibrio acetiphilus DSM 12809]